MIDARTPPASKPLPSVPPEFDRLLTRVGYINYAWTNTESLLIHLLAGLVPTDKETATIMHLSLNTTKARIDLIERLTKREHAALPRAALERIRALMKAMRRLSAIRNQLNHALYAFDPRAGTMRSIQMRIADRKTALRVGAEKPLTAASVGELDEVLADLRKVNTDIWALISTYGFPE